MLFVRTGRVDDVVRVVEAVEGRVLGLDVRAGGWFIGWLETVLTTLWRSCPAAVAANKVRNKKQHSERYSIFFKLFKTYNSRNFFRDVKNVKSRAAFTAKSCTKQEQSFLGSERIENVQFVCLLFIVSRS